MTGPVTLKSICFKCKVNKWIVDFKEGCSAKISTTSVCLACEHAMKIEKLEKVVQEKDVIIKKITAIVENLGKKIEALEKERKQKIDVDLGNTNENRSYEPDKGNSSNLQETVKVIENAVKENMDNIADNGRAIVEMRNDLVNIVNEPGFQKASGRMVARHFKKESKSMIELPISNRYATLSQEETCLIGDSIVKTEGITS